MAELNGNIAVPGGNIGSGEAQVFNPMPTLQVFNQFQTRADNKAKLAALEKMKAEAAAKPKPIDYPEMEIKGSGGLFRKIFNERQTAENLRSVDRIRQSNGDPYATTIEATRRKGQMAGEAAFLDEQEAKVKAATEDLRKQGYVVDPDKILYPHLNEKNYLNPNLVNDYVGMVKSDPNTFNFAEVGKQAEGIAGKVKRKVQQANGSSKEEDFPVFIRPLKNNPYVREISVKDAVPVLLQTPAGREQLPILVGTELQAMNVNPAIANKRLEDLSDIEKGALRAAQTKAVSKYFQGRGDVSVVEDFTTDESKARNSANGAKMAGYQEVKTPVKVNHEITYSDGTKQILPINWGEGESVKMPKTIKIGSNRKIYPIGGSMEVLGDLATKMPDGSYVLNFGFGVDEFQKVKGAMQLTEDTQFRLPDGKVKTRPKGAFISPKEAEALRQKGMERKFKKVNGFRISPGSLRVDEETERKIGPAYQGIDVFIPAGTGEAPELENANPRKKAVTATEEIDIGF